MNRLIQDLLSLSQVEANERLRPAGRVDLASVTHQAVATLAGQASEAGVSLVTEGIDVPATVPGDADQLLQVLTNLIENAIKYGGKTVTVRLCDIPRDPDLRVPGIRVEVVDNGAGIDPLLIPRLTERFFRADAHRSREKGGTGLGLAIVKHIVGRHRGHLRIDSKPGQGSCFAVTLPRQ